MYYKHIEMTQKHAHVSHLTYMFKSRTLEYSNGCPVLFPLLDFLAYLYRLGFHDNKSIHALLNKYFFHLFDLNTCLFALSCPNRIVEVIPSPKM